MGILDKYSAAMLTFPGVCPRMKLKFDTRSTDDHKLNGIELPWKNLVGLRLSDKPIFGLLLFHIILANESNAKWTARNSLAQIDCFRKVRQKIVEPKENGKYVFDRLSSLILNIVFYH